MGYELPRRPTRGGLTVLFNDGIRPRRESHIGFYKSLDCWAWLNQDEKKELKAYIEPLRMEKTPQGVSISLPPHPTMRKLR